MDTPAVTQPARTTSQAAGIGAGPRASAATRLLMVTGGAALAFVQLLKLSGAAWMAPPSEWARANPTEAITYLAWLAALTASAWLIVSVALAVGGRLTGFEALVQVADRAGAPFVRRLAEKVTAASLVISTLAAPATALAQDTPTPPIPIVAVIEERAAPTTAAPEDGRLPAPVRMPVEVAPPPSQVLDVQATSQPGASSEAELAADEARRYTVKPGDNLWAISCSTLADRLGRTPNDTETARYWRTVMDANSGSLRSGDPDLIYPGELIELPESA